MEPCCSHRAAPLTGKDRRILQLNINGFEDSTQTIFTVYTSDKLFSHYVFVYVTLISGLLTGLKD